MKRPPVPTLLASNYLDDEQQKLVRDAVKRFALRGGIIFLLLFFYNSIVFVCKIYTTMPGNPYPH